MSSTHHAAVAAMLLCTTDAAALVRDVDDPGRSSYQKRVNATCFPSRALMFSAVPTGMRLVAP
jgi:hypothetical protein